MNTPYTPPAILTDVLGHIGRDKREAFGEALGEAIDKIADMKAKEQNPDAYLGEVQFDVYQYPWRAKWVEHSCGEYPVEDTIVADVTVTIEEVLNGPDLESIRAEREAKEAKERAKREAEERKRFDLEVTKASAKAKLLSAGLTLEEQVALGMTAFVVR